MNSYIAATLTGSLFGAGLTISGVANPEVIANQLKLTDFHMLITFLSASACSTPTFALANYTNFVNIIPKPDTTYGWVGRFDGNIAGGMLLGLGMAISRACPGTVLVQAASDTPGSWWLLVGGLLGGVSYAKWSRFNPPKQSAGRGSFNDSQQPGNGCAEALWPLVTYELVLFTAIFTLAKSAPRSQQLVHPIVGGILIGFTQAVSIIISKKPLGVSTAYEDIGNMLWAQVDGIAFPGIQNLVFTASTFIGASTVVHFVPQAISITSSYTAKPLLVSLLGGFLLVFGARVAGGCTTGHGISGLSTLGSSSFITVSTMFGGAVVTTLVST